MLAAHWDVGVTDWPIAHGTPATSDGPSGRGAVIGPHRGRRARRRPLPGSSIRPPCPTPCHATAGAAPVLHPWTSPSSSTPRQLAGVLMGDEPARRFLCARCRAPALVCSRCDRGQIYCAAGCAAVARQQSQRDAGRRYQCSRPGRFMHAARTQRWRERQVLLALPPAGSELARPQSVTHQGSPAPALDAVLLAVPTPVAAAAVPAAPAPSTQPCTTLTTSGSSSPAASLPLTLSAWRCHWCQAPCARSVRLDFLRHSRSSRPRRRGNARGEPSHGHSP
jgi:hypothetical protein